MVRGEIVAMQEIVHRDGRGQVERVCKEAVRHERDQAVQQAIPEHSQPIPAEIQPSKLRKSRVSYFSLVRVRNMVRLLAIRAH